MREGLFGGRPRRIGEATVSFDERLGVQVGAHHRALLGERGELASLGRVARRQVPVPRPALQLAHVGEQEGE